MKQFLFRYYGWIAFIAFIIVGVLAATNVAGFRGHLLLLSVGAIFSFIFATQRQKLEELTLFKKLFTEFNTRYDRFNEELNRIVEEDADAELSRKDRNLLDDYFNLCSEEYLFYRQGYIYPEVWKAWRNGMRIFYENERINRLWKSELETDSYYGLKLD